MSLHRRVTGIDDDWEVVRYGPSFNDPFVIVASMQSYEGQ